MVEQQILHRIPVDQQKVFATLLAYAVAISVTTVIIRVEAVNGDAEASIQNLKIEILSLLPEEKCKHLVAALCLHRLKIRMVIM